MTDRERLIEIIGKPINILDSDDLYGAIADHLLKNGVIVPPCKVGDTVYCIEHNTIRECFVKMVKSLTYDEIGTKYFVEAECEIESPFYSDGRKIKHGLSAVWEIEWGSWYRAFRTREEAEKALTERQGKCLIEQYVEDCEDCGFCGG